MFLELFQTFVVVPVISLCSGHSVLLHFLVRWRRRCEAHPTGLGQSNSLMQNVSDSGLEPFNEQRREQMLGCERVVAVELQKASLFFSMSGPF